MSGRELRPEDVPSDNFKTVAELVAALQKLPQDAVPVTWHPAYDQHAYVSRRLVQGLYDSGNTVHLEAGSPTGF